MHKDDLMYFPTGSENMCFFSLALFSRVFSLATYEKKQEWERSVSL